MLTQPWKIEMLGGLCARLGPREITRFRTQKTAALLAYLALHLPQSTARETVLDILWPDSALGDARNSLSVALSALRRQLEPPGVPSGAVIVTDRTHLRLNPACVSTDVTVFQAAVQAADTAVEPGIRIQRLMEAVSTYRGELLPGFYDDWVLAERERLAEACLQAHLSLCAALEQQKQWDKALDYAHRAVALDPLREDARRGLMRLLAAVGHPAAARQQFRDLVRLLREELDCAPSAETIALARSLGVDLTDSTSKKTAPAVLPQLAVFPSLPPSAPAEPADACFLPPQFTRFFGRERELADLSERLLSVPQVLVTITGPGGAGKTRLAVAAAQKLHQETRRTVWFIPLAEVSDPSQMLPTIHQTLGLPDSNAGIA